MPVSLTEWRVRIGRFIQNPPDINKQEMIQRFLERWRAKKEMSKTAASQQQSTCLSSTKTTCQQGTPSSTPETNPVPTCQPSSQTSCQCNQVTKPVPTCQASIQTSCQPETPSCTLETNPVPHSISRRPAVWCITQILFTLLMLMKTCFQGFRKLCISMILDQSDGQPQTSLPSDTKMFSPTSYFGRVLHFCSQLTSFIGFCVLYLSVILLMRSGDVETNPGPESTISDMEFIKLAKAIPISSYAEIGVALDIPYTQTQAILVQHLNNYTNALQDIFMKWNIKQLPDTNKREVLADKLHEIDLGDLSNRLCNGSLIPNRTGAPSRPQTEPLQAECQTKHLSPELIERCAKEFRSTYRSTLCKIRSNPLDPASLVQFKDMYTNLVLQEERGRCKQFLDYNDILDLRVNEEFPNRIMVQGEAGAGKTTLCAKIAWDWVQEKYFSHFTWVLIVPLRDSKKYTIGEIAKSYLAKNNPATVSQITEFIRTNQDRVFIAFDGLDEFSGKVTKQGIDGSETKSCQSQSTDQAQATKRKKKKQKSAQARLETTYSSHSQNGGIRLTDILSSDELDSCPVIVTTRPWRAIKIRSDKKLSKLYTFIHVEGFSKENLSVYIHKYFPNDVDRANQLIQFTDENDVISENMAHYPIYVAMLCLMWKELSEQKLKEIKSLQTFSQIFQVMFVFLKEHYCQKMIKEVGGLELITKLKEINKCLEPVAKHAFTGLLRNTLVFSEDDFQTCRASLETACRVGILSHEDRVTSVIDIHDNNDTLVHMPVFFPHKLFQEYMAGVYLASLYESDHHEFNRKMEEVVLRRHQEFRYLLYFTVSQNKPIANHVMRCMVHFYMEQDFLVDVAFESQDPEVADLIRDSVSAQELKIDEYTTAHTIAGYAFTRPHLCKSVHVVGRKCGPTMSVDVAEMICSLPSLKNTGLKESSFHSDFFATLAQESRGSKVHTLNFYSVKHLTPATSRHLAIALCYMPHLNDLTLDEMDLNEEFCSLLRSNASSIQGSFPQMSNGNFRFNGSPVRDLNSFFQCLPTFRSIDSHDPSPNPQSRLCSTNVPHRTPAHHPSKYLSPNPESRVGSTSVPWSSQSQSTPTYQPSMDPSPNPQSRVGPTSVPWYSQPHSTLPYQPSMDPLPNPESRVGSTSVPWSSQSHSTPPYQTSMDPSPNPESRFGSTSVPWSSQSHSTSPYQPSMYPSPNHQSRVGSTSVPWSSQSHSTLPYQPSMDPSPNPQSRVGSTCVPWSSQSHSTPPYQPSLDPSPNPRSRVGSTSVPWSCQCYSTPHYQPFLDPSPNPQSRVGSTSVPWSSQCYGTPLHQPSMVQLPNLQSNTPFYQPYMILSPNPHSNTQFYQPTMVPSSNHQFSGYCDHSMSTRHQSPAQEWQECDNGTASVPRGNTVWNIPSMPGYFQSTNPHSGVGATPLASVNLDLNTLSISDYTQSPNPQVSRYNQFTISPESNSTNPDQ